MCEACDACRKNEVFAQEIPATVSGQKSKKKIKN